MPPEDRHVVVWDLETVPDAAALARIAPPSPPEEPQGETQTRAFPKLPLHQIVCIGALIAERSPTHWAVRALGAPHSGERSERALIEGFVERLAELRPKLVTFNGQGFDLPVLRYRAMAHRIAAPGLSARPYFNRYTEDAVDLCDALASFDARGKVSLDLLSKVLGLPGKPGDLDGSKVEGYVRDGRLQEVADYCETDVANTYRVWLRFELFKGTLTGQEFEASERQLQEFLASKVADKPHLAHLLEAAPT